MSYVYDQINHLSIHQVLYHLGIEYGSSYCIKEGGIVTSGRKVNSQNNYVHDFSKDRARGGPYNFVRQYLNLSNKETFQRFEEKFGIVDHEWQNKNHRKRRNARSFISYRPT